MKNMSMKKALAILVVSLLIVSISTFCFASGMPDPGDFHGDAGSAESGIMNVSEMILGIIQIIGVAVAVIMLVVLAIKYISAAPSEKGDIKKSAFVYIVGALLLFGGVAVLNIIKNTGEDLEDATASIVVVSNQNTDVKVA